MKKGKPVSVYLPEKRDAFVSARFRFTAFCGLLAITLLGLLFFVTFTIMSRMVSDRAAGLLQASVNAAKRGDSQAAAGGECMLVRTTPVGRFVENGSEYQLALVDEIVNSATGESGTFRLDGHLYCYYAQTVGGHQILSVYDATSDSQWLYTFRKTLVFGFVGGVVTVLLAAWMYSYYVIKPAREALDKQRELVANASHELKTPLTVLSANLSLLAAEPDATVREKEQWLQGATAQITRMNTLVYDMLELSKLEVGNPYAARTQVDLTALTEGAVLCMEAACFERKITMDTDLEGGVCVFTSKEGVEKLLFILLDNAMKYTPEGGTVRVALKRKKRGAALSVTNTGKGLTEEQRKRIFDRFYKAGNAEAEGTASFGLGLSIAKELCRQLGGNIECSSVPGESVTFTVTVNE